MHEELTRSIRDYDSASIRDIVENLTKSEGWAKVFQYLRQELIEVFSDRWFGLNLIILEIFEMPELIGYDGDFIQILEDAPDTKRFQDLEKWITDSFIDAVSTNIINNGPTIFYDLERMQTSRTAKSVDSILKRRREEFAAGVSIFNEIKYKSDSGDIWEPLYTTAYGFQLLDSLAEQNIWGEKYITKVTDSLNEICRNLEIILDDVTDIDSVVISDRMKTLADALSDLKTGDPGPGAAVWTSGYVSPYQMFEDELFIHWIMDFGPIDKSIDALGELGGTRASNLLLSLLSGELGDKLESHIKDSQYAEPWWMGETHERILKALQEINIESDVSILLSFIDGLSWRTDVDADPYVYGSSLKAFSLAIDMVPESYKDKIRPKLREFLGAISWEWPNWAHRGSIGGWAAQKLVELFGVGAVDSLVPCILWDHPKFDARNLSQSPDPRIIEPLISLGSPAIPKILESTNKYLKDFPYYERRFLEQVELIITKIWDSDISKAPGSDASEFADFFFSSIPDIIPLIGEAMAKTLGIQNAKLGTLAICGLIAKSETRSDRDYEDWYGDWVVNPVQWAKHLGFAFDRQAIIEGINHESQLVQLGSIFLLPEGDLSKSGPEVLQSLVVAFLDVLKKEDTRSANYPFVSVVDSLAESICKLLVKIDLSQLETLLHDEDENVRFAANIIVGKLPYVHQGASALKKAGLTGFAHFFTMNLTNDLNRWFDYLDEIDFWRLSSIRKNQTIAKHLPFLGQSEVIDFDRIADLLRKSKMPWKIIHAIRDYPGILENPSIFEALEILKPYILEKLQTRREYLVEEILAPLLQIDLFMEDEVIVNKAKWLESRTDSDILAQLQESISIYTSEKPPVGEYGQITICSQSGFENALRSTRIKELHSIGLRKIKLDGISVLKNLKALDLGYNQIEVIDLRPIRGMPKLESLRLHNNILRKVDFTPLADCPGLRYLHLNNNHIRKIDLAPLTYTPKLNKVELQGNMLSRIDLTPLKTSKFIEVYADLKTKLLCDGQEFRGEICEWGTYKFVKLGKSVNH
ncbi:MAG: leucine-rich repeat domain-containing protein [Candidatus Thorarchaeota archaeon]